MRGTLLTPPPFYGRIARACAFGRPLTKIAALGNADAAVVHTQVDTEGFGHFCHSVEKLAELHCGDISDLPGKAQRATAIFLSNCPTIGTKIAALSRDDALYMDAVNKLAACIVVDASLSKTAQTSTDAPDGEKIAALALTNAQYAMELLRSVL